LKEHRYRDLLIRAEAQERGDGRWGASFVVYGGDGERMRLFWVPTLARYFFTRHEAEQAALTAAKEHIERHRGSPATRPS
jgi:hypothetical protein